MSADELAQLAVANGTDKWGSHWYTQHYAAHLAYLKDEKFTLLEIGVGGYADPLFGAASLRTWKAYFPRATICGLDYFDKSALAEERIKIYQGSQDDPVAIAKIVSDNPGGFRVIVDDGSHRSEHVIATLVMLWQYLENGGWYVIEDTQTSYWPQFGGAAYGRSHGVISMDFIKNLIDGLNWQEIHQPGYAPTQFDLTITAIHFYHNLVFLRKGQNTEGSLFIKDNRLEL